jgi:membrane fusion protein, heavy metal efflux system
MIRIKNSYAICLTGIFFCMSCAKVKESNEIQSQYVMSDKMLESTQFAESKLEFVKNQLVFFGKITADNSKMIEVFPVVGGSVTQVFVELGDYVKKGQLLATIRSAEVAGFEKELEDAKVDVIVTKNNLKVTHEMYDGKLKTERELIEAQSECDKAVSQLQRIEEIYKIYNIKKGAIYEVRSPINGFVIQKNINQDMLLRSDKSDNIFDIAEIEDVWAIANVNESDISQVKVGINAEINTLSYPDKPFYGKVDKIYNIIDPETKAMKARVSLNNEAYLLKPEMRASIKLSYLEDFQAIAIPSQAIVFDKSKYYVMVFHSKNNVETRQIELLRKIDQTTYVSSGLKAGEKVLISNQLLVYDALND